MTTERWPGGTLADTALAVVIAAVSVAGVASEMAAAPHSYPIGIGGFGLAILAALPLIARRRAPIAVTAAVTLIVLVYHLLGYPGLAPAMAMFVAIYSVAAYARTSWGWLYGLAAVVAAMIIPALPKHPVTWYSYSVTGPAIGLVAALVVGIAARRRRLDNDARIREAEVTTRAQMRQRLAEERLTIARELHDVLAHSMSIIAVQSGAALDAIDSDVVAAKQAMIAVRSVAKRALPDLRGALALLRGDGEPVDLRAQPRLADIRDLVDSVRGTGLEINLDMSTAGEDFTPLTELAAFRIVQEALTNVVRHAGATKAGVSLRCDGSRLDVEVVDDGAGTCTDTGDGLGIVGMRERAGLVGGTVHIGPAPAGTGTLVTAHLPVEKRVR